MSLWLPVLREVDRGPDKKKLTNRVYEFMITDPAVLHFIRNQKDTKDDEIIQKLADMDGTNINLHFNFTSYEPFDIDSIIQGMLESGMVITGFLIASRGKKQEEPCSTCQEYEVGDSFFDGCYKVPGMEDYGCCRCRGLWYLTCERRELLSRGMLYVRR